MLNSMRRWAARALSVSVLCTAAVGALAAPPTYNVKVVLTPTNDGILWYEGLALNNDGKMIVIGYQQANPFFGYHTYDKNGNWLTVLGGPSKYGSAHFYDLNKWGDAVGSQTHSSHIWAGVVVKDQGFGATVHGFPDDDFDGYFTDAWANGLSDNGHVVGQASSGLDQRKRAYIWRDFTMQELGTFGGPTSEAIAVNNLGVTVGVADQASGGHRAFLYRGSLLKDLGTLGGASATPTDINDAGQVVGTSQIADGSDRAFLFQKGKMSAIPTPEGATSSARAINRHGLVLGAYRLGEDGGAYLYDGSAVYKVKDLLSSADQATWTLSSVVALNDRGWLLANGRKAGDAHDSVLFLKPVKQTTTGVGAQAAP